MEKVTENVPKPPASISQAVKSNGLVFVSGQIAANPKTGAPELDGPFEEQAERVIGNLKIILEASGTSLDKAVKVNVYLSTMNNFSKMCSVYDKYFTNRPARTTVAARLFKTALVEIELVAEL